MGIGNRSGGGREDSVTAHIHKAACPVEAITRDYEMRRLQAITGDFDQATTRDWGRPLEVTTCVCQLASVLRTGTWQQDLHSRHGVIHLESQM
ncbi:uncharacterized protein [Anabrus simplex]|uniref:uncharacterized protein isoform X3 n=1 Tax=Anabrus simplex TaxID=316456 RepID=UPI0035A3B0A8